MVKKYTKICHRPHCGNCGGQARCLPYENITGLKARRAGF